MEFLRHANYLIVKFASFATLNFCDLLKILYFKSLYFRIFE